MGGAEVPSTLLTDIAPAVIRVSNTTEHTLTTIQQCTTSHPHFTIHHNTAES